jgi:aminoglycoside 3-N-acetyltransferase
MSERDVMANTPAPRTRASLAADLRALGLRAGGTVVVHASLRAIGWMAGGAPVLIQALQDAVTSRGTLVMPAQSAQLSDPAGWQAPPAPRAWHDEIRASLPEFDPRTTPTRNMGVTAELFRTWPGARRSNHPTLSFAALGPEAARITGHQALDDPFGEDSPLARLHALGADILLIGVGLERCTALHLAERRAWPDAARVPEAAPVLVEGARRWVEYLAPPLRAERFPALLPHLAQAGLVRQGPVGSAAGMLIPLRDAVDEAVAAWRR